ncbi:hypothetical protein ACT17_17265 [Mycolicibacterium conceptionense]|jgi:hypothetical protein|uniref:Putative integral membrane protein n=1 Tax=Mycolicibacterium conceptionense TaxID=451644 RepID=A0A0J8U9S7_9MYCO|nr:MULTISPECIES: GAP family protein [Mycolicibacterium]KMV17150.1 hypothetical protein ACT17_17265 [Mycolicibacterium conceptionense]OMB79470.1 hypothetical protein A5743_13880 [Mycolicibacterium conceptionense]ORV20401.1 hypothetical protein AWB98_28350 [Mycolicibacterium conceptionense]QZH62169.1 GAP family protein [Mycolicibacterium farcinogenes]CQD23159.1 putative integral membrane protein [Mycolicibacterium conceptionense]
MWIPLLVMAAAVSLEPFRIGMTVVMLNRPRPLLQLLAFLIGGFAMGTAVGVIVLFLLRPALGSAHFTLPRVQLAVGALALLAAAVLAVGRPARMFGPKPDRQPGPLVTRIKELLGGHSLWTASAAGLGIALPSVDYLAALALIVASGAAAATQVGALLLFNVVAFGLVEIPLISYLVAPERTRAGLAALHDWLQTQRRQKVAAVVATVGAVLLAVGIAGL